MTHGNLSPFTYKYQAPVWSDRAPGPDQAPGSDRALTGARFGLGPGRALPVFGDTVYGFLKFRESFLVIAATLRHSGPGRTTGAQSSPTGARSRPAGFCKLHEACNTARHKPFKLLRWPSKSQGFSFAPTLARVRSPAMSGAMQA